MTTDAADFADLPLSAILRINARCDAFEAELRAGKSPQVNDFLADTTGPERAALLHHLTTLDAEYRSVTLAEFIRRLTVEQLIENAESVPATATAQELADHLIHAGTLTTFQARTLLGPCPIPLALNDYLLLDHVGAGGMGTVYRAVHRRMKRTVAVKLITTDWGNANERDRWFQREVEAAAKLVHPHIVTAYDAGAARGVAYLVSEFVDGTDLHRWVEITGPVAVAEAISLVRMAALGLAYAHERGVIHRDVKPANLIRTTARIVRVLDLGLARLLPTDSAGPNQGSTAVVGTPGYMAPEQVLAPQTIDARADVYGLGCTLHFLLTGQSIHALATHTERVAPAAHADTMPPRRDAQMLPALTALVQRMTAQRREDRPASMNAVIAALDELSAARPIRRHWRRGVVMALLLLAVLGLLFALWPRGERAAPLGPALREIPFAAAAYQAEWATALGWPIEIEPMPGCTARLIPPGRLLMGTPAHLLDQWLAAEVAPLIREQLQSETERPGIVTTPFYLGTTEVTVGQFRRFVRAQTPPYVTLAERTDGQGYRLDADRAWRLVAGASWQFAGEQVLTDDHPVCNLGRDDCADYCRWLTIQLGGRYTCRLPTEVEWEFACRAGSAGLWSCGSDPAELGPFAWFERTIDAADGQFRPVARKAANGFGLYDLHGNLAEWCTADTGAVVRGGNIRSSALGVRSAVRVPTAPSTPQGGFRVVFVPLPR